MWQVARMDTRVLETLDPLCAASTASEVYAATVDAAAQVLDADVCEIAIADGDTLTIRAASSQRPGATSRPYSLHTSIPGRVVSRGRGCVVDDRLDTRSTTAEPSRSPNDPPVYRSLLCLPFGEDGVFVGKATTPGRFAESDRETAGRLVSAATAALTRIEADDQNVGANGGSQPTDSQSDRLEAIVEILSHDVKSPLTVAQGSLELIESTEELEHLDRATAAISRIEELIDNVVLLARTGDHDDTMRPVELATILDRIMTMLPTEEATIELEATGTVLASEQGLRHILENIIKNAITHAGPSVTIRIGLTSEGIYVEDDGPGIPPDQRDRVFERGVSTADGHSGLGLSIARRVASAHGWSLSLTESSDGGARFEIAGVATTPA